MADDVPVSLRRVVLGGLGVLLAAALARSLAMQGVALATGADLASPDPQLRRDGLLIGVGMLAGAAVGSLVLAWVARPHVRAALAMTRPSFMALTAGLAGSVALVALFDAGALHTGRPLVEDSWLDAYRTAPLLLLALALTVTSGFEELYFRGFLQGGLTRTRLGPVGAIAITALLFSVAHVPGDAWRFLEVYTAAVFFGVMRYWSGSSLTMILPHVLGNWKVLATLALLTGER